MRRKFEGAVVAKPPRTGLEGRQPLRREVRFRVSDDDVQQLAQLASAAQMPASEWLRAVIHDAYVAKFGDKSSPWPS